MSSLNDKKNFGFPLLAIFLVGMLAYGLTIRDGLNWSEDASLYILHAKNLAEGLPYNDRALPDYASGRVFAYPYGLPVVLAAAHFVVGLDLHAYKWIVVTSFVLFTVLFAWYVRRCRIENDAAATVLALVFLANPNVWDLKDGIMSDGPFLVLSFLALVLYDARHHPDRPANLPEWLRVALVSLALVGAYAMRSAGLALVAAIVAYEILRFRKISITTIVMFLPLGGYLILEHFLVDSLAGYLHDSVGTRSGGMLMQLDRLWARFNVFRWAISDLFASGRWRTLDAVLLYGVLGVPALIGYVARLIRRPTVFEFYAPIYLCMFVVANIAPYTRYMLPFAALLPLYALEGIVTVTRWRRIPALIPAGAVLAALFIAYGARYSTLDYGRFEEGHRHPSAQQMIEWIKQNTRPDDVLVSQKGPSWRLTTGRRAAELGHCPRKIELCGLGNVAQVWRYIKFVEGSYLIVKRTDWRHGFYPSDADLVRVVLEPNRRFLKQVFQNRDFTVFAITGYP